MPDNKHRYDRRTFLSRSIPGVASISLMGMSPKLLSVKNPANKKIIYRELGKTGTRVPVVSMGVYTTDKTLIEAAIKSGVRLFSTAHYYQGGLCEKAIGEAVHDPAVRKEVLVATKIYSGRRRSGTWPKNPKERFLEQFAKSLDRLQTKYLDILYLYNVRNPEELDKPELLQTLSELKQQKKTRWVGFTTHTNHVELLNKASDMDFYDLAVVSFNYTMSENKTLMNAMKKAAGKGIGLVAMKTQCGGNWSVDGYRKPKEQLKNQTAMLKWVLNNDFISTAIPAMESFEHLEEDFSAAYDLSYTAEEKRFLADENVKYSLAFCQQCRQCAAACPKDVNIPCLMRIHMYAYQYRNMDLVRLAQEEVQVRKSLDQCRACKECSTVCPNSVPIARNISALKKLNWA